LRATAGEDTSLNEKRGALIEARRRLADLEYRERSRELIPAEQVERFFVATGQALRSQILLLSQTVRSRHPNIDPAIVATLEELHRDALQGSPMREQLIEGKRRPSDRQSSRHRGEGDHGAHLRPCLGDREREDPAISREPGVRSCRADMRRGGGRRGRAGRVAFQPHGLLSERQVRRILATLQCVRFERVYWAKEKTHAP
jgi:hypothetical protein